MHAWPLFFVQTPRREALLHFEPLAQDAEPQHTPSTQLPVEHWLPAVHAVPSASFATHEPPLHQYPVRQWVSVEHVVRHPVVPH